MGTRWARPLAGQAAHIQAKGAETGNRAAAQLVVRVRWQDFQSHPLGTTLAALQSEMQQFLSQTAATTSALAGDVLAVGRSVLPASSTPENQGEPGEHLLALLLAWYQLSGRLACAAEQGLQPLLRQVQDNAVRLTKRS